MLAMHNNCKAQIRIWVVVPFAMYICERGRFPKSESPSPMINLRIFVQWCSRTLKGQSEQRGQARFIEIPYFIATNTQQLIN
jgi:hypothetical protein